MIHNHGATPEKHMQMLQSSIFTVRPARMSKGYNSPLQRYVLYLMTAV